MVIINIRFYTFNYPLQLVCRIDISKHNNENISLFTDISCFNSLPYGITWKYRLNLSQLFYLHNSLYLFILPAFDCVYLNNIELYFLFNRRDIARRDGGDGKYGEYGVLSESLHVAHAGWTDHAGEWAAAVRVHAASAPPADQRPRRRRQQAARRRHQRERQR